MFVQLVSLDSKIHRDLHFTQAQSYGFAGHLVMIPLIAGELYKASRDMVIVFPLEGGLPQALVGLQPGHNMYIDAGGQWIGRYVPAHLRRYPFILTEVSVGGKTKTETERRFVLQFDAKAQHFQTPGGTKLFDHSGKPTELLNNIRNVLLYIEQDQVQTLAMVAELDAAGLLVEKPLTVKGPGEGSVALTGMRILNVEALSKLAPEPLAKLRNSGALAVAYAHLISLTNLEDGWLAKQARTASEQVPDLDQLFGGADNDLLRFN